MVRTYTTRRAMRYSADLDTEVQELIGLTVHEPEPISRDTGLLDVSGEAIIVVEKMGPIGFQRLR